MALCYARPTTSSSREYSPVSVLPASCRQFERRKALRLAKAVRARTLGFGWWQKFGRFSAFVSAGETPAARCQRRADSLERRTRIKAQGPSAKGLPPSHNGEINANLGNAQMHRTRVAPSRADFLDSFAFYPFIFPTLLTRYERCHLRTIPRAAGAANGARSRAATGWRGHSGAGQWHLPQ